MKLLPEFQESGDGPRRLLISIRGEQNCLAALHSELLKMGAEVAREGRILLALAPAASEVDPVLMQVAAVLDRNIIETGRPGAVLCETRMVPDRPGPSTKGVRLGERFLVQPAGASQPASDDIILLLAGSWVFGSGLHPSTRLAVRAMEEIARQPTGFPRSVLDVGTGSGLLALVAARLGAAAVTGIDICPEAVETAERHVLLNGLEDRVRIASTPLAVVTGRFDLILANLTPSVQLRLAAGLQGHLRPGGELIVSGLQGRQQGEVAGFWERRGLRSVSVYTEDDWRALRLRAAAVDG